MAEKFLEMKSICKSFGPTQILFNIDFDIECGEVHALVGENGAGKSTLIKVLAGVHKPESGQIYINVQEAKIESPKKDVYKRQVYCTLLVYQAAPYGRV